MAEGGRSVGAVDRPAISRVECLEMVHTQRPRCGVVRSEATDCQNIPAGTQSELRRTKRPPVDIGTTLGRCRCRLRLRIYMAGESSAAVRRPPPPPVRCHQPALDRYTGPCRRNTI